MKEESLGERMIMKVYLIPSGYQRALSTAWIDVIDVGSSSLSLKHQEYRIIVDIPAPEPQLESPKLDQRKGMV